MARIHKRQIVLGSPASVPADARILSVGVQQTDAIMVWYVTEHEHGEERHIHILGTGWDVSAEIDVSLFIGTVQTGPFVWHVFDSAHPDAPGGR